MKTKMETEADKILAQDQARRELLLTTLRSRQNAPAVRTLLSCATSSGDLREKFRSFLIEIVSASLGHKLRDASGDSDDDHWE